MDDLERQKAEITARMAVETPPLPDVNPNIAEIYRHKVQQLSTALADPKTAQESTMAIRSLLGEIVLTPGDKRGEIHGNVTRRLHGHASKLRAGFPAEISELLPQESLVNGDILGQKPAECNLAQRRRIGANAICRQAHVQACSASSPEA